MDKGRQTKYCSEIRTIIRTLEHATNAQILHELQKNYPQVSATTVHRATARLATRGELGTGPADQDGAMRYDANTIPHDHFMCLHCGRLRDMQIAAAVLPLIQNALEDNQVSGHITISGVCTSCASGKSLA